VSKVSSMTGL